MTSILRNKNCLITGASGGLGSALTRQLAKSGCNLFLVGRNIEKLSQLSKEILEKFSEISVCYSLCDLSNAEEINESASEANDKFGSIDVAFLTKKLDMVCTACIFLVGPNQQGIFRFTVQSRGAKT